MKKNVSLVLFSICCIFVLAGAVSWAESPDPKLIKRMQELSEKLQKASEAEKPAIMKALQENAMEMVKQAEPQQGNAGAGGNTPQVPSLPEEKQGSGKDLIGLMEISSLGKAGKIEAIVNIFNGLTRGEVVPKDRLMHFYHASTWTALSLHDTRSALAIAQNGINQCDGYLSKGVRGLYQADDEGIFFQRCNLLRARTMALALANRIDEAKSSGDETLNTLWNSLTDPKTSKAWENPMNFGFMVLFMQTVLPVIEAVNRNEGEEEAAKLLPWAQAAIASQAWLLETLPKKAAFPETLVSAYKRMIIQARGQALLLAGKAEDAVKVLETYPWKKLNKKTEAYLSYPLMYLSQALYKTGKEKQALEYLQIADETLAEARKTGNIVMGYSRWWPTFYMGQIHEKGGKTDEAIKAYQTSVGYLRELYSNVTTGPARREYARETDKVYARLIRLFLQAGKITEAFKCLEESQSKAMLDLFGDVMKNQQRDWPDDLKNKLQKLKKELMDLESGSGEKGSGTRGGSAQSPEERRSKRQKIMTDYDQTFQEASQKAGEKKGKAAGEGYLDGCAKNFQGGEYRHDALKNATEFLTVVYQTAEDPCWVLVAGNGQVEAVKLEAGSKQIRTAAMKMRNALTSENDDWKAEAKDLYKLVFSPIEEKVKGKERLAIVPDGALWYVPFASLLDDKDQLLVSQHRLGIVSGVGLVARYLAMTPAGKDAKPDGKLLVMANPDGSLPHALEEGKNIAGMTAGKGGWTSALFSGKEALKALFMREAESRQCRALHLATHGVLDEANPLRSYLVLHAGEGQNDRLEVMEIAANLDLRHVAFAVLSACNTAMGALSGGNEVIGLQNGFQEAGVPAIIASLWEVSDESTAKLMGSFYGHILEGKSPGESLTLAMRENTSLHPNRWAPFQVYGLP